MAHDNRELFDFFWKFKLAGDDLRKPCEHWLLIGGYRNGLPSFSYDDFAWETITLPHDFVVSDVYTTTIDIRSIRSDAEQGFFLNEQLY